MFLREMWKCYVENDINTQKKSLFSAIPKLKNRQKKLLLQTIEQFLNTWYSPICLLHIFFCYLIRLHLFTWSISSCRYKFFILFILKAIKFLLFFIFFFVTSFPVREKKCAFKNLLHTVVPFVNPEMFSLPYLLRFWK